MRDQKGQAVIIILLIMVVGLTIGLSVVSRSILNVKLSTQSEESSRAFTAAEAGIEVALEQGPEITGPFSGELGDSKWDCTREFQGAGSSYVFPNVVKDKVVQFYFSDPKNVESQVYKGAKVRVLWGTDTTSPALEVTVLYKDPSETNPYRVAKFALDPNDTRADSNKFCSPSDSCPKVANFKTDSSDSIGTQNFKNGATIDIGEYNTSPKFLMFARLRLLYEQNPSTIGVKSDSCSVAGCDFPSQGSILDCLGYRVASGVSRRIQVYENYPAIPEVFDYVLFNGSSSNLGH
jgi:hypothetical protein